LTSAQRHDLPSVKVIADDGTMTDAAGRFKGMDRFACRKAVVDALDAEGLLERVDAHRHSVGHCYRCKTMCGAQPLPPVVHQSQAAGRKSHRRR
jgi:valyl-tRNA synthetase